MILFIKFYVPDPLETKSKSSTLGGKSWSDCKDQGTG
jgi:hypothetical protein